MLMRDLTLSLKMTENRGHSFVSISLWDVEMHRDLSVSNTENGLTLCLSPLQKNGINVDSLNLNDDSVTTKIHRIFLNTVKEIQTILTDQDG